MTEGFEDTGYENTWTEQGAAGGNEDYTLPGTPPTGGCSQGLYFNVNEAADWTVYDHGSALDTGSTTVTVEFYIRFVTIPGAGDLFTIYSFGTSATVYNTGAVARINLQNSGGTVQVRGAGSDSSAWVDLPNPTTTYNKITLVMHTTAASSSISVNDAGTQTFTRGTNSATQYHHLGAPSATTGDTAQIIYDVFSY